MTDGISEARRSRAVPFTVNATAYIIAGHLAHHIAILRERYF